MEVSGGWNGKESGRGSEREQVIVRWEVSEDGMKEGAVCVVYSIGSAVGTAVAMASI